MIAALGNARAAALLARQPATEAAVEAPTLEEQLAEHDAAVTDAKATLIQALTTAAAPLVGRTDQIDNRPVPEWIPGAIAHRIIHNRDMSARLRRGLATNPLRPLWEAMYTPEADEALTAITDHSYVIEDDRRRGRRLVRSTSKAAAARREVLQAVLTGLLPSSEEHAPIEAPDAPLDLDEQIRIEQTLLEGNLRSLVSRNWRDVRTAVLVQFGALTVGPRAAIARANEYYRPFVRGRLMGNTSNTLVHPNLQAAFDRATAWLTPRLERLPEAEREAIRIATSTSNPNSWWSTNVRENRNARHKLSDHSFGWAVDFQASLNPNVGSSGALAPVQAVTGDDPTAFTTAGRTAAEVQTVADELREISREYVAAMESEATLTPVLLRIANEARAGAGVGAALTDGAAVLAAAVISDKDRRARELRRVLWPEAPNARAAMPAALAEAATTLGKIGHAFRTSFRRGTSGDRVNARTEATPGSVAAHGFMSLPPALVAALAGSDAGGLIWLGTAGVHDYMHFELAQEPPLYTEEPVARDTA
ncbi:MAG TPA: hypothetical protein VIN04_15595, partial [Myxococcota bacterium]